VYGLAYKSFKTLDDSGRETIEALKSGRVQAADIFTTCPCIKADGFVQLADPLHVFTAENVVPLAYRPGVNRTIISTLNAVSGKLTTAALLSLDTKTMFDQERQRVAAAARWLKQVGLG
jgi:osmoprotectant transport system substrate-binding protein